MRPLSKINWMVLTLISLSVFYLLLTNQKLETDFIAGDGNSYSEDSVGGGSSKGYENAQVVKRVQEEITTFKTKYSNLWRTSDSNYTNKHRRDGVDELTRWTKSLANSRYLKSAKPKKILVFDGIESYYGTNGELNCPFLEPSEMKRLKQKCIIKEDILGPYFGYDAFVSVRNWKPIVFDQKIPLLRHVYFILESPFVTKYADFAINNAILASYSSDSDIVLPYGYFQKFGMQKGNTTRPMNYAKDKTKLAAIVVSNCQAKNDRLRYVQELQKYIPIDVYGECGSLKCDNCFDMIKQNYKFYLAFEKANCRDYITEKFWTNALSSDVIPVVMGAHPDDYKTLAPLNSYIHVEDFATPKDLADYLILVHNNDILYNSYFAYRQMGEVINIWEQFFCRLCSMLHYADIVEPPLWQEDSSWGTVNHCLAVNKWFWGVNI